MKRQEFNHMDYLLRCYSAYICGTTEQCNTGPPYFSGY